MTVALPIPLNVGYDPTTSMVGNGVAGQVYSSIDPNGNVWRLVTQNLPGFVRTGGFPTVNNPNSIRQQNLVLNWPYRGGLDESSGSASQNIRGLGYIGMSVVGLSLFGPANPVVVPGGRGTFWRVNSVFCDVNGADGFGGLPDANGVYHYTDSRFITGNAWNNIAEFASGYVYPDGHSKLLGWAADGYPIYGPFGYAEPMKATSPVTRMTSGYQPQVLPNRPTAPTLVSRGIFTQTTEWTVRNATGVAPGLKLLFTLTDLTQEIKVVAVNGNVLTLNYPISINNAEVIETEWPLGSFCEDFVYTTVGEPRLDKHNGRYCVTPDFPYGTYAYFITVDQFNAPQYPYIIGNTFYGSLRPSPPPPPASLEWISQQADLGVIPHSVYFSRKLEAVFPGKTVQYTVIAGDIPEGSQLNSSGLFSGVPTVTKSVGLGVDITSKFTVRAFTTKTVNGATVVDQFKDKTFSITVAGRELPQFITPAGLIGTFYDGQPIEPIQILFTDDLDNATLSVAGGNLPPGLTLSPSGLISGYIIPAALIDEPAGYDLTPDDDFPYDFLVQAENFNYQFTLEINNGNQRNLRTFEIYVISRNTLTADTTQWTADTTEVTADQSSDRLPFFINPEGSIGTVRDDNFFAYQFNAVDLDGQAVRYIAVEQSGADYHWNLPQGLSLDPVTGWLYGTLPAIGLSEITYTIAIKARLANNPSIESRLYFYTLTVLSGIDKRVTWITPTEVGTIIAGTPSLLKIEAVSPEQETLLYKLADGSDSKLPQGLTLLPSGLIAGTTSFATFTLDNGKTTFDVNSKNAQITEPTTFDLTYRFTVNAYSPVTQEVIYKVVGLNVQSNGEFYFQVPNVAIAPPEGNGVPATVGSVTIGAGKVISASILNQGFGYRGTPQVTVTGGGPFANGAVITAITAPADNRLLVSETKEFIIRLDRVYNAPVNTLYIECTPPLEDRELLDDLVQNPNLIPPEDIFRIDDFNFGLNKKVYYAHAYGLNDTTYDEYMRSLQLNHYWKQLLLGPIKTARALDANGNVIYEVIYSEIIDNLVNNEGVSVGKAVTLDVPVTHNEDSTIINTVYPNSLINMRTQVIDTVGSVSGLLPLWMTSIQEDNRQLGFVPAWIIAYIKPGQSKRIAFNILQQFGDRLNRVNFTADRYILGRGLSKNWDPIYDSTGGAWVPTPAMTTFDLDAHYRPLTTDGSTEIFFGGVDYAVGDKILIKGSALGGLDGFNDLTITISQVNALGTIRTFFFTGVAPYLQAGNIIYGATGTTTGSGTGATFDIIFGSPANTRFDGGSMLFVAPVDNYETTDQYDKYLVFPKRNILE